MINAAIRLGSLFFLALAICATSPVLAQELGPRGPGKEGTGPSKIGPGGGGEQPPKQELSTEEVICRLECLIKYNNNIINCNTSYISDINDCDQLYRDCRDATWWWSPVEQVECSYYYDKCVDNAHDAHVQCKNRASRAYDDCLDGCSSSSSQN